MPNQLNASYRTLRRLFGELAIFLPVVLYIGNFFVLKSSISHFYFTQVGTVFTGALIAFGLFLFTYRGYKKEKGEWVSDNFLTNLAGFFALVVAVVPTAFGKDYQQECVHILCHNDGFWKIVHFAAAGGFLGILGGICIFKFPRSMRGGKKGWRNRAYVILGSIVWLSIAGIGIYSLMKNEPFPNGVFWGEAIALWAFGIAWLIKGEASEMMVLNLFKGAKTQAIPVTLNLDAQIGATLSSIAYLRGNTQAETFALMAKALQQKSLPTNQKWGLVWGPVTYESDLMYIAKGPKTKFGNRYAVVIRGTIRSIESSLQDLELSLVDLPWTDPKAPDDAKISIGIKNAFDRLKAMKQTFPSGEVTALDFLKNLDGRNEIMVTGHSLGGCLASVVPLWLKAELGAIGSSIKPITLAGQSAGNQAFATYFQTTFPGLVRFYNELDVVPKLWNYYSLESVKSLYPSPGPKCDLFWKVLMDAAMLDAGHNFFQPDNGHKLDGKVYDENGWFEFAKEVGAQHNHNYYMYLLGIPLRVIQGTPFEPGLGAGWWPPGVEPVYEEE